MSESQAGRQYRFCEVTDDGPIRTVKLNRPEVMNALTSEASHELEEVWNEFASRNDLWVGILGAAGDKAFCTGMDLKAQAAGKRGHPKTGFGGLTLRFDLNKPVIAAVNGYALGGGFEIALACDLIVASENAVFGLTEARVGLLAAAGGVHRLPRAIPQKVAMGMILTGSRMSARDAERYGLVNEVVPVGEALAGARRWAERIVECSPMAVRAAKEVIHRGFDEESLELAIRTIYPAHQANLDSQDYLEGPRAFAEKRKPVWQNR